MPSRPSVPSSAAVSPVSPVRRAGADRVAFSRRYCSSLMPRPRSSISSTSPCETSSPLMVTRVCGGENVQPFSSSSARRWTTSETAWPHTVPFGSFSTSTRVYSAVSETALRTTSISGTAYRHCRGGRAPPRITRFSACRRSRVDRWSTANNWCSRSGSSWSRSITSSTPSCWWSSGWRRRARLRKTARTFSRAAYCWAARSSAARWAAQTSAAVRPNSSSPRRGSGTSRATSSGRPAAIRSAALGRSRVARTRARSRSAASRPETERWVCTPSAADASSAAPASALPAVTRSSLPCRSSGHAVHAHSAAAPSQDSARASSSGRRGTAGRWVWMVGGRRRRPGCMAVLVSRRYGGVTYGYVPDRYVRHAP